MNSVIETMTYEMYETLPGLRFSQLRRIEESPLAYRWHLDNPDTETRSTTLGGALHALVLEPETFDNRYARRPPGINLTTKEGRMWKETVPFGVEILGAGDTEKLDLMRDSLYRHPLARELLEAPGINEGTIQWKGHGGRLHKARMDRILTNGVIIDLKTTSYFEQRLFQSDAWKRFYHAQFASYDWACRTRGLPTPPNGEHFAVVVSSAAPYDVAVYAIGEPILAAGLADVERWLRTLSHCEKTNEWPGKYPEILEFTPPKWALDSELGVDYFVNQAGGIL